MNRVVLPKLPINEYFKDIDRYYDIHFCEIGEIDEVVDFIDQYWKKDHILVLSRELLDWQHFDKVNGRHNFVVARHIETHEIHAILGFVPTSQFDENIEYREVWPCIWKSKDDVHGLGIMLYYYLTENIPMIAFSSAGINSKTINMYKMLKFQTGKLDTYYILNDKIKKYNLLKMKKQFSKIEVKINLNKKIRVLTENKFNEYVQKLKLPICKSARYYINRFFKHPIYRYESFGIFDNNQCVAIIFIRECRHQGSKALRIVDFIGEQSAIVGLNAEFMKLLYERNAEYIDFLSIGWDRNILEKSGFVKKDNDLIILPNYYEPFELNNVDINYAFKPANKDIPVVIYKADGDQDRPNVLY